MADIAEKGGARVMNIDFASELPIYLQVAEGIADGILSGVFPEETQVPSTTEISTGYQINPATVLKGMGKLVDSGILYKKRGVGMFVKAGAAERILGERRQRFYDSFVVNLLNEAEKLKISREELIRMIGEGERRHVD